MSGNLIEIYKQNIVNAEKQNIASSQFSEKPIMVSGLMAPQSTITIQSLFGIDFELDEEGFVIFQPVEAGVTQWFNRNLKDFETYNYSNNYFINFIKKVEICNNKEYKF